MMRHTTVTCDRCREPIDAGMTVLEIVGTSDPTMARMPFDLCGKCTMSLREWLRCPEATEAPTPVEVTSK